MNDMKEEAQKKRALEARHSKDTAKHKKEQRLLESKMKRLEADKRQKDVVLRRKLEEVSDLHLQFMYQYFSSHQNVYIQLCMNDKKNRITHKHT